MMTVAILGVLIGAQILPLSQLVLIIHSVSFAISKLQSTFRKTKKKKSLSQTYKGLQVVFAVILLACLLCMLVMKIPDSMSAQM